MQRSAGQGRMASVNTHRSASVTCAAGPEAGVLALQRYAGNRAVRALMRGPSKPNPATAGARQAVKEAEGHLDQVVDVADDFLRESSGSTGARPLPQPGARSQQWPRRGKSQTTRGSAADRAAKRDAVLRELDEVAGSNPVTKEQVRARDLARQIREGQEAVHGAERHLEELGRKSNPTWREAEFHDKPAQTAKKTEATAVKKTESTAVKKAESTAVKKAESTAVKKVEQAAAKNVVKAETKAGVGMASKAGRLGLSLLLPGPEDAVILMAQFAGSYEEAWEAIEERNTRDGIAFGIAAGMIGLEWQWVSDNLWRRFAYRSVETQILNAVGKAERAFNDGLTRGHKYGAAHARSAKKRILGEAFALLAQEGFMVEEENFFSVATVGALARVLMPLADDFLAKAAANRKAREQREREQQLNQFKMPSRVA